MVPALQVDELERKVRSRQEQLFLARQELSSATAELKMRASQAEGGHPPTAEGPERGGRREGPWGVPPMLSPLGFQSVWNWRRNGPDRAWKT